MAWLSPGRVGDKKSCLVMMPSIGMGWFTTNQTTIVNQSLAIYLYRSICVSLFLSIYVPIYQPRNRKPLTIHNVFLPLHAPWPWKQKTICAGWCPKSSRSASSRKWHEDCLPVMEWLESTWGSNPGTPAVHPSKMTANGCAFPSKYGIYRCWSLAFHGHLGVEKL